MKGIIIGVTTALAGGAILGGVVSANVPAVRSLFGGATLYTSNAMKEAVNNAYNDAFKYKEALEKQLDIYKYDYDALNETYKAQIQQGNVDKATIEQMQQELDEKQQKITNCQLQIAYYVSFFEKVNLAEYSKVTFVNENEDENVDFAYSYVKENEHPVVFITPEMEGYKFLGWSEDKVNLVDLSTFTTTENVTLYALFVKLHTITFEANGVTKTQHIEDNGNIETLPTPPPREGYQFDYWMLNNVQVDPTTITITEDMTFVAHYSELYSMDGVWRFNCSDSVNLNIVIDFTIEDGGVSNTNIVEFKDNWTANGTSTYTLNSLNSNIIDNTLNNITSVKIKGMLGLTKNINLNITFVFDKVTGKFNVTSFSATGAVWDPNDTTKTMTRIS